MPAVDDGTVAVRAVRSVGPDAVAIDLATPDGFAARPGQFVKLGAPGGEESRFYTISSPDVEETLEVTIEVDPEGDLGPWFAAREPGDELRLSGPFGNTYYDGEDRVVVLAGGPGVGPAVGIAERALAEGNEAAVVYLDDQPMHEGRLEELAALGATVDVVDDEDDFAAAAREALGEDGQVFVYGFADFLDVATDAIAAAGREPENAKVENFG